MTQAHAFKAIELAIRAQDVATDLTPERGGSRGGAGRASHSDG